MAAATRAAKAEAAMNESSRSIRPPWPGMRRLESFTPNRRLTADSNRSPSSETTAVARPSANTGRRDRRPVRAPTATAEPERRAGERARDRARPRLARRDARPQPRAADRAAGEIGGDVRAPDDGEQPQDRGQAIGRARRAAAPRLTDERAGVERARRRPERVSRARRRSRQPPPRPRPRRRRRARGIVHGEERRPRRSGARPTADPREQPLAADEPLPFPQHDRPTAIHQKARKTIPPNQAAASAASPMTTAGGDAGPEVGPDAGRPSALAIRRPPSGFAVIRAPHEAVMTAAGSDDRAEPTFARRILVERRGEGRVVEIRPENRHEHQFGVGRLPEQEVRQPHLARGADDEVRIGDVGGVEPRGELLLADRVGIEPPVGGRPRASRRAAATISCRQP